MLFFFFFPKDTFHLPTISKVCLYCSEMEKYVQGHLKGQHWREEVAGGGSNGQDQVTKNLNRDKQKK